MAKRKGAKALFEVINDRDKGKKPLGVPGWFDRARAAFNSARAQADQPGQVAPAAYAAPAPPPPQAAWTAPANEPMLSMQDGRVRISLNQVSAVVSVLGFLLVMSGAFYFGRQMGLGHKDASAAATMAQNLAAADTPGGANAPGKAAASARSNQAAGGAADDGKRKKGLYYLVIQGGIRDQQDARTMIDFLADNDVAASVVRDSTNKWKVLADKPFSRPDGKDVQDYKSRISSLGKDYMRKHPYDFRDCYPQMEK